MKLDVMIIDDEQPAIDQLTELIEQSLPVGRLRTYTNSAQAWRQLQLESPDIVFLDIEMPGLDGLTLAERVLQENLQSRIVFVTAYHQYALTAFEHNALDYLLKPVRAERFLKTLQRIMDDSSRKHGHAPTMMNQRCQVRCFGTLEVMGPYGQVQWLTAKAEELFAYLIVHKQVKLDQIIDDVFPDSTLERAKWNIHTTLYRIRHSLRDAGLDAQIAIQYKNRKYILETQDVEVDLDVFFASSNPQQLLSLYKKDLFSSFDVFWTHTISAKVQNHLLSHLNQAIEQANKEGDFERVDYYRRQLVDFDN
jgi:two-component system LytT family response regulator